MLSGLRGGVGGGEALRERTIRSFFFFLEYPLMWVLSFVLCCCVYQNLFCFLSVVVQQRELREMIETRESVGKL